MRAAYEIRDEEAVTLPLVFASPHSGRHYPKALMSISALDAFAIRRSEDVLVDTLLESAPSLGVPLISATHARAYVDVNREPYELDQSMFEDELPSYANSRTARVAAGLGSIAKIVAEGQEIYKGKLRFAEAKRRIEAIHLPYHQALEMLLEKAKKAWGFAILIDWHSMPSAAAGGPGGWDIVLGDRFGASCSPILTGVFEEYLKSRGYRVARNTPYAGGYTTEKYGRPGRGTSALQIELNRKLYLDEATLEPHHGFDRLTADLKALTQMLYREDWTSWSTSVSDLKQFN